MLKAGKVVALDSTSALIKRISGSQLVVHLAKGALPDALKPMVSHPDELISGSKYTLRVNEYSEVEPILARLREAGAVIGDMQLQQADLEDVFIQIMEGEK
jgi:ABC-2 type transport system ATP-binding protein